MIKHWCDTSALLHQKGLLDPDINIAISPITLQELEYIKEHEQDDKVKYLAREAVRAILTTQKFEVVPTDNRKIDKMIKMINEEYADYFDIVPECRDLLSNLKKIKSNIEEKEYEMEKVKEQQLLLLEKNNAKVKTRGQYPM